MAAMAKEGRIRTAVTMDGFEDHGASRQSVYFCLKIAQAAAPACNLRLERQSCVCYSQRFIQMLLL